MAMKARLLRRATPGRLGRLILRRLFDKGHACRRPHLLAKSTQDLADRASHPAATT
jgi:hypothetical protein